MIAGTFFLKCSVYDHLYKMHDLFVLRLPPLLWAFSVHAKGTFARLLGRYKVILINLNKVIGQAQKVSIRRDKVTLVLLPSTATMWCNG